MADDFDISRNRFIPLRENSAKVRISNDSPSVGSIGSFGEPYREVYYSAFDLSEYHTCINCIRGLQIPQNHVKRNYLAPTPAHKCPMCERLEQLGQAILGAPISAAE